MTLEADKEKRVKTLSKAQIKNMADLLKNSYCRSKRRRSK